MNLREYFKRRKIETERGCEVTVDGLLQFAVGADGLRLSDTMPPPVLREDTFPSHIFPQPDAVDCL